MSTTISRSPETSGPRIVSRISLACNHCRSRKVKCDGNNPCSGCRIAGHPCVFRSYKRKRRSRKTQQTRLNSDDQPAENSRLAADAPGLSTPGSAIPSFVNSNTPTSARLRNDPVQYKRQRELRAGIGVSNVDTGCFQFYGPPLIFLLAERD